LLDLDLDGWTMRGGNGRFSLAAEMSGYGLDLRVEALKPPALHDGDGYIDYGDGTGSYYVSWTRMAAAGALKRDDSWFPVTGEAWMDHQWGAFATYKNGGWDWFSLQLEDGKDIMLYVLRRLDGATLRVDGSIVAGDGALTILRAEDFSVTPTGEWTSPATGTSYPSGWRIAIPGFGLDLAVTPSMPNQELDTRRTTGVIYWEGEVQVESMRQGMPIDGLGYVELTGYAPVVPLDLETAAATPAA
jgi:predicted secreted hydrolase